MSRWLQTNVGILDTDVIKTREIIATLKSLRYFKRLHRVTLSTSYNIRTFSTFLYEFFAMSSKKKCFCPEADNENFVPPKQWKKSLNLTPKEVEEALKIHALIYSSQKKVPGPVDEENTNSVSTPTATASSSNAPDKEVPSELPHKIGDNKNNTLTFRHMWDRCGILVDRLKETLAREAVSVCLTFDFRNLSATMGEHYIAITAHYINKNFDVKRMLLAFSPFDNTFLLDWMKGTVKEYGIENKVIHAVAKYSPRMEKTINKLELCNLNHCSWCFIESLNQAIVTALAPVQYLFEKMKTTGNYINKNRATKEFFYDYQNRLGNAVELKTPQRTTVRCWKSKYLFFEQFITLKDPVVACLKEVENTCPVIDEEEWDIAEHLCQVLKPFVEVISFISDESDPLSGSMLIILTNSLKSICSEFLKNNTTYNHMVIDIIVSLRNYLVNVFGTELKKVGLDFGLCTFLDPRFKIYGFQNDNDVSRIKKHVHELVVDMIEKNGSETSEQHHDEDILAWKVFDKFLETIKPSPVNRATQEINMYIDAELLPRKGPDGMWNDPAQWWREHKAIYPNLSEIYRVKCPIVGTAVQCERLISYAAELLKEDDSKGTLHQLAFLKVNQNWE